jgi:hypothetical protein
MTDLTEEFTTNEVVQRLLAHTAVEISSFSTAPYLPADILWDGEAGEITLSPWLYYQGPALAAVIIAIVSIHHTNSPIYDETPADEFNRLSNIYVDKNRLGPEEAEICKISLVEIDSQMRVAMAIKFAHTNGYLDSGQLRETVEFFSTRSYNTAGIVGALSAYSLLRSVNEAIDSIEQSITANRFYEIMVLLDMMADALAQNSFLHRECTIFHETIEAGRLGRGTLDGQVRFLQVIAINRARAERREYDVAISFAEEDRAHAEKLATELEKLGYRVYRDTPLEAGKWGRDTVEHLTYVFRHSARFCVVFTSRHYKSTSQTKRELMVAQSRAFEENSEYILPITLDDTRLESILPTIGAIDARKTPMPQIARILSEKLS